MVAEQTTASSALNSDGEDTISTSSEDEKHCDGVVVLRNDGNQEVPSFGNISVMNSNEVHFGNKTFYHGPVTIKQFLYANGSELKSETHSECSTGKSVIRTTNAKHGLDNPVFESDNVVATSKISDNSTRKDTQETGNLTALQRIEQVIQKNKIILVSLSLILLISLTVLTAVMVAKRTVAAKSTNPFNIDDEQDQNTPIVSPLGPNDILVLSNKVKIVSRLEWLAQPPTKPINLLKTPVPYVIIHHTATENCSSQAQCIFQVRNIQTFHIESRGWWDIGYNFLVGGDGEAYEGRGWQYEGAHSFGYNVKSIGIAFVGTFLSAKPVDRQIVACKRLIELGVSKGFIQKDYKVLAARQLQTTQSPGQALYEDIKTWKHWSSTP